MKTIKHVIFALFLTALSQKAYCWGTEPVLAEVISTEYLVINGTFEFQIKYKFLDTITFSDSLFLKLPERWGMSINPALLGNTYNANDSVIITFTINYPLDAIPYFVQHIVVSHYLAGDFKEEIYASAMIYFTPYNTIEIWDLQDFSDLTRRWHSPDEITDTTRVYIDKNDIPVSDIDTSVEIDWYDPQRDWEDDWMDNFREVSIPGLAYDVLMKPIPPDSINYYNELADGITLKSTFTGSVNGHLRANFMNDIYVSATIPLAGIRVKLRQQRSFLGITWWTDLASGYTNENGYFSFTYDTESSGNYIKLGLQFISYTNSEFEITATNFWGSRFEHTIKWDVGQTAHSTYNYTFGEFEYPSEAFKTTHWSRRGFQYFKNQNIQPFDKRLRIRPYAVQGSWFDIWVSAVIPAIHIKNGSGRKEGTTHHEFGHVTMYKLQGNDFTNPFGEQGAAHHYWSRENTSRLAWVEGWANAIEMILDAIYWNEDGEYGYGNSGRYEKRNHFSWGSQEYSEDYWWNIQNGFRSEYYIACAIYDLWDGPSRGLPLIIPESNLHGWNDTEQGERGWRSVDDVELPFKEICRPLIEHTSDSYPWNEGGYIFNERCFNVQDYIYYLLDNYHNDCKTKSDISRVFRENRVLWNIPEYEWGWNITNISSDMIRQSETKAESGWNIFGSFLNSKNWIDYYLVNYHNKDANNIKQYLAYDYITGHPLPDDFKITDNYWLGIWDTFSNVYRRSDLGFNNELSILGNYKHATFTTCGIIEMDVRYGNVTIGGGGATANIEITDGSILRFRGHGNIDNLLINSGSELIIKKGGTLFIQSGTSIKLMPNSKITVESGGYICIEDNADIFVDYNSVIHLKSGAINGVNPTLNLDISSSNCSSLNDYEYTGNGQILIENCSDFATFTNHHEISISSSITWSNESKSLKDKLIIQQGGELIIQNSSTIEFGENAKVIVKQGGKLIVVNSTLKNLTECNNVWQGIEVWGTKTASQRPLLNNPNQGVIELKNGAVIENAIVAIRNHRQKCFFNTTTGGVIICEDAIFRNNKTAVEFAAYRNFNPNNPTQKIPDFSRFKNTKFIVDDEYLGGDDFTAHVRMWDVHGINFSGCEFENNISNLSFYSYPNKYKGIHSIDASYSINGICNLISVGLCADENYTPSTFKGFNYAIMTTSSSTNSEKINVFRTNFENNRVGMYASGLHNLSFNKNKIQIGTAQEEHLNGFGIYASGSTGYRIEENEISKLYNLDNTWGISIVNSGTANNTVYKNTMNDLSIGLYAFGTNKGSQLNSTNGLRFLCNKNLNFESNQHDILVLTSSSKITTGGISLHQIGANSTSAGNEFSQNPQSTNNSHINNLAHPFFYFYTGVAQPSNMYYPEYNNGNNKVILSNLSSSNQNQCLSNYQAFSIAESNILSPQQVQQLNQTYNSIEYDYVNTIFVLNQMIDGGNTPALLYEIQETWSSDAWTMRDELISYSPYLSQEALIEAALTGVLPDAMLLDVCIQNPSATMGDEFIEIISHSIPNPLPEYMVNLIISNWETEDARFLLEKSIADKSLSMSTISDLLISDLMSDTISRESEIINWLYRRADFSDYLMIVDRYMHNNDNSSAASILSTIQDQFVLNEEQANLIEDYFWFVNFREDLKSENRNFNELTSTEIDLLRQKIEETDNKISEFSKNILCYFYDICTEIELPLDIEPRRKKDNNLTSRQALKLTHLKVYPNPANDYVNFEWKLNSAKNREIRISTVTGVIIQRHTIKSEEGQWLWDSRNIKEGTYIYELLEENKRIDSGKITVVK